MADSMRGLAVWGVPVRLHFTFVLLLCLLILVGFSGEQSAAATALYFIALFASVLLHELGHAWVAKRYGIRTVEIVMYPIGGVSRLDRSPTPGEELWIALAGPSVNLLIAFVLGGVLFAQQRGFDWSSLAPARDANLLARIVAGNLLLGVFNLLPAFPMDGGRVLRAVLARSRPEAEATRIAAAAGRWLAILLGLYGVLAGLYLLVFIAFFVYVGAAQEGVAARGRSLTEGIPVRAAMVTEFHTLPHGSTIRDAADLLLATSQHDFPVVLGAQVLGLLGRGALLRAMATDGPEAYVGTAMDREFTRVAPELDLAEALPVLSQAGSCALVMQGDDLVGLLTSENVTEFLLLRQVGMEPQRARVA